MTCEVCVYQEGDTAPSFSNESHIIKSRKACKCEECGEIITVGDSYWKISRQVGW